MDEEGKKISFPGHIPSGEPNSPLKDRFTEVQLSAVTPPPLAPSISPGLDDTLSGLSLSSAPPPIHSEFQTGLPTIPLLPTSDSRMNSDSTTFNPATTLPGLLSLPGGLPSFPNLPNLNLTALPDLNAVSLAGFPPLAPLPPLNLPSLASLPPMLSQLPSMPPRINSLPPVDLSSFTLPTVSPAPEQPFLKQQLCSQLLLLLWATAATPLSQSQQSLQKPSQRRVRNHRLPRKRRRNTGRVLNPNLLDSLMLSFSLLVSLIFI
ncbi:hypothetical protein DPEC_G00060790 [Dallia pectoralis]|uniref:Uncharacterized protein n=1 Tax=Dallia pectoralis TaxID=75939 RepID=A0ACC2H6R2_DALPE|nr:hypothetical protein DPEC_G00060790 [Dallia pectoralis]